MKSFIEGFKSSIFTAICAVGLSRINDKDEANGKAARKLLRDMHTYERLATKMESGKVITITHDEILEYAKRAAAVNDETFTRWYSIPWYKRLFATLSAEDEPVDHLLKYVDQHGTKF